MTTTCALKSGAWIALSTHLLFERNVILHARLFKEIELFPDHPLREIFTLRPGCRTRAKSTPQPPRSKALRLSSSFVKFASSQKSQT